ncbi:MAG: lamin tail domain-containing protein [Leptospiraceae bacterium]|nr:lamin tail domain-containing protein [Leptospiraceae bacterium]
MLSPLCKKVYIGLILAALAFPACQNDPDDDLLTALLNGQTQMLLSSYSIAGQNSAELENQLLFTMNIARHSLYCSFQDIALPAPIDALHRAWLRGVDVRVGLDEDNKDGAGYGQLALFLTTTGSQPTLRSGNSGDGQVYMNICVADKTRIWASSTAPTPMDMQSENAFAVYIQSQEDGLAEKFNVEMDLVANGSFGSAKQRLNRRNHWLVGGSDVGIYFAPEESPLEGFVTPRIRYADTSLLIYASEWLSNELDTNDLRERKDLAYEYRYAAAPYKMALTPWYGFIKPEDSFEASANSWNYLSTNGLPVAVSTAGGSPSGGMSFIVMDGNTGHRLSVLSSHPYSKRTDSSHDGFSLMFEDPRFASELSGLFNSLLANTVPNAGATGDDITTTGGMEIVISEINWKGYYKNDGTGSTTGEYVEFYSNHSTPLNVSGWKFICNSGSDTTVFTFPSKTVISPKQYFLVSRNSGKFVQQAHLYLSTWSSIPDTSKTCRLEDANATVIDTAGNGITAFSGSTYYFGKNDATNKKSWSMERNSLTASGALLSNWHTNSHSSWAQNFNINADYITATSGTPGYANSTAPDTASLPVPVSTLNAGELLITEVHFDIDVTKGFEGGGGTLCTEADDEFIEVYNNSGKAVDMGGATLQYGTSGGNFSTDYTFPAEYRLNAGARVVVVARDAGCYNATSLSGVNALFDTASWSLAATGATFALVKDSTDLPDGQAGPAISAGTSAGVLDYVGTETNAIIYKTAKAPACVDASLIRTVAGTDTNNNLADFACGTANGTPGH